MPKEAWHFTAKSFDDKAVCRPTGPLEASRQNLFRKLAQNSSVVVLVVVKMVMLNLFWKTHSRITKIRGCIVFAFLNPVFCASRQV
jgi:hypothetical protein